MPKAVIDGWVEIGEEVKKTLPTKCPKCGKKLSKTDASILIGIILVFCSNYKCRWCEEFTA
jgi:hypothetical protein